MGIFGFLKKDECFLCSAEVGPLSRARLKDKNEKIYICNKCRNSKLSPYADLVEMSKADVDSHLLQRQKDAEIYDEFFADFNYPKLNEVLSADYPWGYSELGKYELRYHKASGNYCIWEKHPKYESFDVFHEDELQGACIHGEYTDLKDENRTKNLPDRTVFNISDLKEYPDENMKKLYLTIFTSHPYLYEIELPVAGNEDTRKKEKIRENAIGTMKNINESVEMQNEDYGVKKKEVRSSVRDASTSATKALFTGKGIEELGGKLESAFSKVDAYSARGQRDERIAGLRERNKLRKFD
ncbi:MAG: hypothetical protein GX787_03665 [Tissierellia bacterium]|jgi:hypothetical protein|nr:hypothetical protein [Tissierellia bacterium]